MNKLTTFIGGALLMACSIAWAAVNVNTASAEQLQSLDGIGEVKSKAIIAHREAEGDFESKDELDSVDGIGSATLDAIRDDITVGAE